MDPRHIAFVVQAIKLRALGCRTKNFTERFDEIDADELGARLKANGGLKEMVIYVSQAEQYSIESTWESSPIATNTLEEMRAEKNA